MQLQFVIWWFTSHWSVRLSLCGPYCGKALFYLRTWIKMPDEAQNSKIFIYSKAIKRIVLLVGKNEIQQPILRCIDLSPCLWEPCQLTARCLAPSRLLWLPFFLLIPAEQICCWACLWLTSAWQPPWELRERNRSCCTSAEESGSVAASIYTFCRLVPHQTNNTLSVMPARALCMCVGSL